MKGGKGRMKLALFHLEEYTELSIHPYWNQPRMLTNFGNNLKELMNAK